MEKLCRLTALHIGMICKIAWYHCQHASHRPAPTVLSMTSYTQTLIDTLASSHFSGFRGRRRDCLQDDENNKA
jgi:hypothetical protein